MFCSKCGNEIDNEAVVCPECGCPTKNFSRSSREEEINDGSQDYLSIHEFYSQATTIRNLGIAAAVLMFGIGIIFSIIVWVKQSHLNEPKVTTTNVKELGELEDAKRRIKLGGRLSALPLFGLAICIFLYGMSMIMSI